MLKTLSSYQSQSGVKQRTINSCAVAMMLAGSSRLGSGAEHIFGHCLDELFPNHSRLHGVQVAFGTLVTELNMIPRDQACLTERLTPLLRESRLSLGFGDSKAKGGSGDGRI